MKPRSLRIGRTLGKASLLVGACLLILSSAISVTPHRAGLANEIQAIHAVVSVHTAQAQRLSTAGAYAMTLQELRDWFPAGVVQGSAPGYRITMTGRSGRYEVSAVPLVLGETRSRTFFSDQTGVIRQNWGSEPATAESAEIR